MTKPLSTTTDTKITSHFTAAVNYAWGRLDQWRDMGGQPDIKILNAIDFAEKYQATRIPEVSYHAPGLTRAWEEYVNSNGERV